MIPKIIHYAWFGGAELPQDALQCIESWRRFCPDYEIIEWNESNTDLNQCQYAIQAYGAKKWAFVSDYARVYALVNYGGIYLDTDVELTKSLDSLLADKAFAGFESNGSVSTAIMACEKGFSVFEKMLADYHRRSFIREDGSYDLTTNVILFTQECKFWGFELNGIRQNIKSFAIYPSDWFCPKSYETGEMHSTENTHAIHHFSGTWLSSVEQKLRREKHDLVRRHPWVPSLLAGVFVRMRHGVRTGEFAPLFEAIKGTLPR